MNKRIWRYLVVVLALSLLLVPVLKAQEAEPITILATWGGEEEAGFREVLDAFTEETGIPVEYEGQRDIPVVIQTRVAGGNPPDVAMIPRPGVVASLARDGAILPLTEGDDPILPQETLEENYGQAWIDLGTLEGGFYGLIAKANSKSTVWYKPSSFEELGVETPEAWDDWMAIANQYVENGQTPFSIGAQDAWTLTDWFENIYVRIVGPEMYNQLFITHEVEWTDDTVVQAMEFFREAVAPTDEKLAGGAEGALSTGFIDAFDLVLREDAAAEMYYEGGFMSSFGQQNFPDLVCGEDYSFFAFPEIDSEWGKPVVGGGDMAVVFDDRPEVREFIRFLATPDANTIWATAEAGAVISPNMNVDVGVYDTCKGMEAEQLVNAEHIVFDGSDLAPPAVGGDALFTGLQEFLTNPDDIQGVLEFVEQAADDAYESE